MDEKEIMGEKNLLTDEDHALAMHDASNRMAQELMDHVEQKYQRKESPAAVSVSLLSVAILAREVSKGQCTKEMFLARAADIWDGMIAVKR